MLQQEVNKMLTQKHKTELDAYIGKFLNHRYLIRDLIGKGGGGKVYLAEDCTNAGIPVAVKVLSLNLDNQTISQRFAREIFISSQLGRKSKHIVRILGYGITDDKIPFYVMEYLQGKNLLELIDNQPLRLDNFFDIARQICLGLQCAYQGVNVKGKNFPVVHRNIKPENIFITQDEKKGITVKILDFGVARFLKERAGATLSKSFMGSLPYSAPEHMEGRKLLDIRSDIYSLGIIMYQMLCGKHPFELKSNSFGEWYQAHRFEIPLSLNEIINEADIPLDLEKLVMGCLAKEIKNRPQDITEILDKLELIQRQTHDSIEEDDKLPQKSSVDLTPTTLISKHICLQKKWPGNKPIAPIAFPHLLYTVQGKIPTFWAMLPQAEILLFLDKKNTTEFIQKINLYPMIMWVTVLHEPNSSLTRWLSYFLDIKDKQGERIVRHLAEKGYYHLLLFALEEPTKCAHVTTITILPHQREQLLTWLETSHHSKSLISSNQSKTILKAQYEKTKPKILQKLLADPQKKTNIKRWFSNFFSNLFKS
ncbi:serine/threonine-protein kinase [Rivularia sp. UHCC 0363]|uniref:serine/threonine protein kinase n=1 Tax=Rivularia sp. UHCC 0363 TaxID=3110244 RepID=UPI002B216CB5|nr:serine/threonine-protein kinase [Rivularia sp. UHCC 0363]MEA5594530.1 serine/threonine-protein kinase [Rivularia sp. UHCC 0363]